MTHERRRHRLFVTRHSEYHLRADECVGVRDRASGSWIREHAALRLRAVQLPPQNQERAFVGSRIQFFGQGTDVLTSPVVAVLRPRRDNLEHYVSLSCAGTISAA